MQVTVEISYYPLHQHFGDEVLSFLKILRSHAGDLAVKTNSMSTQISGPLDQVMDCVKQSMKEGFQPDLKASVILKVFNEGLELKWLDIDD